MLCGGLPNGGLLCDDNQYYLGKITFAFIQNVVENCYGGDAISGKIASQLSSSFVALRQKIGRIMAEPPHVLRTGRADEAPRGVAPEGVDRGAKRNVAARLHRAVRAAGGNMAVASRSGVPLATVNNYVRGRYGMKIEPLSALAVACNVSLDWLVLGGEAAATEPLAEAFPTGPVAPPPGLGEAQPRTSPAGMNGGIDVAVLTKAIEIVAAIAGTADFLDQPKMLSRRIATTYALLIGPEASCD